jgi:hypothetical protein
VQQSVVRRQPAPAQQPSELLLFARNGFSFSPPRINFWTERHAKLAISTKFFGGFLD